MIAYEVRDGIAWVLLNRPEKLNAMTPEFWVDLPAVMTRADSARDARVVVFHGAGRCFSVGADIGAFSDTRSDPETSRAFARTVIRGLLSVEQAQTPTIAAVHGHALGGGCELTMVCDMVVADETANFGTPETSIGLLPGLGILRGRAHVGLHWLKYMILTGNPLDAHQAQMAGLVQAIVPRGEHLAEAARWAQAIASRSATAAASGKAFLSNDVTARLEEAVDLIALLHQGDDAAAGIAAFLAD